MLGFAAIVLLCCITLTTASDASVVLQQVSAITISPQLFNWTSNEGRNEFRYEASLLGLPDLPPWIHYTYCKRTHRGYLYAVAPLNQKDFKLEVIALNKKTYETRQKILEVVVLENENISKYQIQLKISNLNVEDMFDQNRTETLFNGIKEHVWNVTDLQMTFLAPAVELGARNPLRPNERVGKKNQNLNTSYSVSIGTFARTYIK